MVENAEQGTYRILGHASRCCFARVLRRLDEPGDTHTYICSNCGRLERGRAVTALCACGSKLKTGAFAGLACVRNLNPTPDCPAEIVVTSK